MMFVTDVLDTILNEWTEFKDDEVIISFEK